jgi:hypothetical protein
MKKKRHHEATYSDAKVANRNGRGFEREIARGRFATPADPSLHGCSPCSHAHVRRNSLGFVSRPRGHFLSPPVPNPLPVSIRAFFCIRGTTAAARDDGEAAAAAAAEVTPVMATPAEVMVERCVRAPVQVRFCRYRFFPAGDLGHRGSIG